MYKKRTVTAIIPALNEEPSIARVVNELFALTVCPDCGHFKSTDPSSDESLPRASAPVKTRCSNCAASTGCTPLVDNIIVGDNGSTDNTAGKAKACGAIVVDEQYRGYGAACLAALDFPLEKDIVVFVDGDHSVQCSELPDLLDPLFSDADLVIGSRTLGYRQPGSLSTPQVWGNRLASVLIRVLWGQRFTDLGPFRALDNDALNALDMKDRRFGWTVEMQIRALQLNMRVAEVPVTTRIRIGHSKISGTVRGVIGASKGILGTIAKLYWQQLTTRNAGPLSVGPMGQRSSAYNQKDDVR